SPPFPYTTLFRSYNAGPVLGDHVHDPHKARFRAVALLVIHRVDGAASAEVFQRALNDVVLGGVDHDRQRGSRRQPRGQFAHIGDTVPADVIDARIQHVRALARLTPGDFDAIV